MSGELPTPLVVEILATAANLVYIVFLIREKIACWGVWYRGQFVEHLFVYRCSPVLGSVPVPVLCGDGYLGLDSLAQTS